MSATAPGKEFMGRGWAFPFRIEPDTGRIAMVVDEDDVKQSIRIILGTSKGERQMRPDFGCGIHDLVYGPIDMATVAQIRRDVADALRLYEARIVVTSVEVPTANAMNGRLDVEIEYRIRQTNQPGNLVFPFYFKEGR